MRSSAQFWESYESQTSGEAFNLPALFYELVEPDIQRQYTAPTLRQS
jgi:hypothetical protein